MTARPTSAHELLEAPRATRELLEVRDLGVEFTAPDGSTLRAVRGVSFTLRQGETPAVVGESGSGKSTTALALTRMLPGTGRVSTGSVLLDGQDLAAASDQELRAVRGARIGMIFQDPMTALNPVLTIGRHLDEVLRAHGGRDRAARRDRAVELLDRVGIPEPHRRVDDHHQRRHRPQVPGLLAAVRTPPLVPLRGRPALGHLHPRRARPRLPAGGGRRARAGGGGLRVRHPRP